MGKAGLVESDARPAATLSKRDAVAHELERESAAGPQALASAADGAEPLCARRFAVASQQGRSLCMAHWDHGEGATTLSAALALRAAALERTRSFCLVDLDQKDRGLTAWAGLLQAPGISNVLRGECALSETVASTWLANLSIVGAGTAPLEDEERERLVLWPDILRCLRQDFHYAFVDLPRLCDEPTLPLWAPRLGEVILVTRAGQERRQGVERALTLLHQASAQVLGVVVNTGLSIPGLSMIAG